MDAAPRVSVIVRTKDRPRLLKEALGSLRVQSFSDFEVVVINDGGASPGPEILEPHPGRGLKLIDTEPPRGRARALNTGLANARGVYVAYLDDDDLYRPDHLATLAGFLDGTDLYRAAYTDVEQIVQTLGEDGRYHDGKSATVYARGFDAGRLLSSNFIPIIGLMHHRVLADEAGLYDETFDLFEDWDFLIRLARITRFHRIPRVTAVYRVRDDATNATSETPWLTEKAQSARRRLFEKHWGERTVDSEMALVDSLQREIAELRDCVEELAPALRKTEQESKSHGARVQNLEDELSSLRADISRTVQASAERELELRGEVARLSGIVSQMNRSLAWRLFTPYWKLKSLLKG
ncbi:MAG: glycosyltransferase [Thermoanaerobaculia bacterium]